jgi:hypothetical protein
MAAFAGGFLAGFVARLISRGIRQGFVRLELWAFVKEKWIK